MSSGKVQGTGGRSALGRVWLVEDSRLEAQRALSLLGERYEVESFTDAESMLERLSQAPPPDMVMLDWQLPGLSGLEACRYVRGQHDEVTLPILMFTSRGAREDLREARAAGANDYLTKPYEDVELLSRVGTLVHVRRAVANAQRAQALAEEALADRARAEEALRESEARLSAILASLEEGIVMQDAGGTLRFANAAAERHLGLSAEQLAGRTSSDPRWRAVREDGSPYPGEEHPPMRALRTGRPLSGEVLGIHHPDGRLVWLSLNSQPLLMTEGHSPAGVVTSFLDITERKASDAALRLREAEFRTLAEASPDAVFTTMPDGLLTYVSTALLRYTGLEREAITGIGYAQLIHPDHRERSMEAWARALRTHEPYEFEHPVRGRDGGYRWHLVRALPVRDADGQVVKWVGTSVDVHALRETQAELQRRTEFEKHLIGIVSHDLRNPLSSILLGAQALLRDEALGERQLRGLLRIQSSGGRAIRMIRDLLDFTQARLGDGLPMKPQPLDLHAVTRQVVEEVQMASPERTIEVVQEGEGEGLGDPDRLAQVVGNLLSNALHYSPQGTPVRVITRGEADALVVQIHNRGAAIAPELLPRLFQPMQRGGLEGSASGRSVGLGLYIVDQVVRAHGGTVAVRSTEAEGTTFTVRLPR